MDRDALLVFVRYHVGANDRILTTAASLTDEELRRPDTFDRGSAFDTMRHLVDVDWSWREFCVGNDVGDAYVWDLGFVLDDVAALHAFARSEGETLRAYVASLDDDALREELRSDGHAWPRWLILAHVVNHGTQHRSELARYLTVHGHSPGELDLLDAYELP